MPVLNQRASENCMATFLKVLWIELFADKHFATSLPGCGVKLDLRAAACWEGNLSKYIHIYIYMVTPPPDLPRLLLHRILPSTYLGDYVKSTANSGEFELSRSMLLCYAILIRPPKKETQKWTFSKSLLYSAHAAHSAHISAAVSLRQIKLGATNDNKTKVVFRS